jgi:hypothetical protein
MERGAHLTVDWGRNIYTNKAEHHAQKTGHTCEGVNLSNEKHHICERGGRTEELTTTNPNGPPVGTMTPNDAPFIAESSDKLPAVHEDLS